MSKLFAIFSWLVIGLMVGIILLFGYWFLAPQKPVEFYNLPHKVENKIVKSGDYIKYYVEYCKYDDTTPEISKSFADGLIYHTPDVTTKIVKKGCGTNEILIYVPKALPSGNYTLNIVWKFPTNPVNPAIYYTNTEQFTVIDN